jgi:hypothetical protein
MKMKTDPPKKYKNVKDPQGTDHYCPVETDGVLSADEILDACVEKDVVERYSGNIEIKDS